ncbi:uroporphyrinogen-III C-methyltransferase [Dokdonella sp.]|uniref:uroporphyrinogen-III C-methyltransferase n=1 Tax=Dokdonella sp. TaxID=2291710 RepID=UPI001B12A62F|nr:uroporphyrinogen-III C-methyltransferase [Dokdonella sp.]MBO9661379.1 uroporphyrinogen-III C-methyltransferase [Dokdonella sp.]
MSDDTDTALHAPAVESPPSAPESRGASGTPAPRRGGGGVTTLVALIALAAAGGALWFAYSLKQGQADAQAALRGDLQARVDELARGAEQRKREFDALKARLADADGVNKSVREELLGLGERSRHLEDAVANLAEQRMSGRDALAMNEAEFLLQLAQERLTLFHDAQAAIAAYRLADSALAAAEDPVFASVRQSIGAERQALEASKPAEVQATLTALERLRGQLPALAKQTAATTDTAPTSRWQGFLSQFVRVSHSGDEANAARDVGLTRSLTALDLREAEAALLAGDAGGYAAALERARGGLAAGFDADAAPTKEALAELDRLLKQPLAPALPELGTALKELRNLRATRALSRPPATPAVETPQNEAGT